MEFFHGASEAQTLIEVHIDHPVAGYQQQTGICYRACEDFLVMGPEGAPARICIPYFAIRWFRRLDDQI